VRFDIDGRQDHVDHLKRTGGLEDALVPEWRKLLSRAPVRPVDLG
jgi:hypothetical protein